MDNNFLCLLLCLLKAHLIWISCKNRSYQNRSINTFILFTFRNHHFIALYNTCFLIWHYANIRAMNTRHRMIHFFLNFFRHLRMLFTVIIHSVNYTDCNCSVKITVRKQGLQSFTKAVSPQLHCFAWVLLPQWQWWTFFSSPPYSPAIFPNTNFKIAPSTY